MKKTPNATVAHCPCPMCGRAVSVRENKARKLYLLCDFRAEGNGGCGMITPNLNDGQQWIRERMTGQPAQAEPEAPKQQAPAPAQVPVNEPKQPEAAENPVNVNEEKKPGVFASLLTVRVL